MAKKKKEVVTFGEEEASVIAPLPDVFDYAESGFKTSTGGLALLLTRMRKAGVNIPEEPMHLISDPDLFKSYKSKTADKLGVESYKISDYNIVKTDLGWGAVRRVGVKHDPNKLLNQQNIQPKDTAALGFSTEEEYQQVEKDFAVQLLKTGLDPRDYDIGYKQMKDKDGKVKMNKEGQPYFFATAVRKSTDA